MTEESNDKGKKPHRIGSTFTTIDALNAGELFFMLLSFIILAVLTYSLYKLNYPAVDIQSQRTPPQWQGGGFGGSGGVTGSLSEMSDRDIADMVNFYLSRFLPPAMLLIAALLASIFGYSLLRAAGTSTKQVLPPQDHVLLSQLLIEKNEEGIINYIRLSSLSGVTGTFTKIGLTGLPLATIALTIFFALLAVMTSGNQQLYDFAKLTLGAFIGSYVQRQVSDSSKILPKKE